MIDPIRSELGLGDTQPLQHGGLAGRRRGHAVRGRAGRLGDGHGHPHALGRTDRLAPGLRRRGPAGRSPRRRHAADRAGGAAPSGRRQGSAAERPVGPGDEAQGRFRRGGHRLLHHRHRSLWRHAVGARPLRPRPWHEPGPTRPGLRRHHRPVRHHRPGGGRPSVRPPSQARPRRRPGAGGPSGGRDPVPVDDGGLSGRRHDRRSDPGRGRHGHGLDHRRAAGRHAADPDARHHARANDRHLSAGGQHGRHGAGPAAHRLRQRAPVRRPDQPGQGPGLGDGPVADDRDLPAAARPQGHHRRRTGQRPRRGGGDSPPATAASPARRTGVAPRACNAGPDRRPARGNSAESDGPDHAAAPGWPSATSTSSPPYAVGAGRLAESARTSPQDTTGWRPTRTGPATRRLRSACDPQAPAGDDIHPARDDHEALAVGQEQIAVLVQPPDIAQGRPAARVIGGRRLVRVVVVFERVLALEIDVADLARRQLIPFIVADMDHAEIGLAHRAGLLQPLVRVDDGHAVALGPGVVFDQDRPPPVDHRLLDRHGTRGRGVDGQLQRRDVVFRAHLIRQFQDADEVGRHPLAVAPPCRPDAGPPSTSAGARRDTAAPGTDRRWLRPRQSGSWPPPSSSAWRRCRHPRAVPAGCPWAAPWCRRNRASRRPPLHRRCGSRGDPRPRPPRRDNRARRRPARTASGPTDPPAAPPCGADPRRRSAPWPRSLGQCSRPRPASAATTGRRSTAPTAAPPRPGRNSPAYCSGTRRRRPRASAPGTAADGPPVDVAHAPDPVGLAQDVFQDLARGVARQGRDDLDRARDLEAGEGLAAGVAQGVFAGRLAGAQHHQRLDRLAPAVVGHADHGGLGHGRMLEQGALDLSGIDVLAAGHDHVLDAVANIEIALGVQAARVAAAEPAVGVQRRPRFVLGAPIAQHGPRRANGDLARLARRQTLALRRQDGQFDARKGPPSGGQARMVRIGVVRRRQADHGARRLGQPINLHEVAADDAYGLAQQRRGDGRGAVDDLAHAREIDLVHARIVQQDLQGGGHDEQDRRLLLLDVAQQGGGIELFQDGVARAPDHGVQRPDRPADVAHRHGRQVDVVGGEDVPGRARLGVDPALGQDVAMADQHAFGPPGPAPRPAKSRRSGRCCGPARRCGRRPSAPRRTGPPPQRRRGAPVRQRSGPAPRSSGRCGRDAPPRDASASGPGCRNGAAPAPARLRSSRSGSSRSCGSLPRAARWRRSENPRRRIRLSVEAADIGFARLRPRPGRRGNDQGADVADADGLEDVLQIGQLEIDIVAGHRRRSRQDHLHGPVTQQADVAHLLDVVAKGHARLDDDVEVKLQRPGDAVIPHGTGQQDAVGAVQPGHGVGDDAPGVVGLGRDRLTEDGREFAKGVLGLEPRQPTGERPSARAEGRRDGPTDRRSLLRPVAGRHGRRGDQAGSAGRRRPDAALGPGGDADLVARHRAQQILRRGRPACGRGPADGARPDRPGRYPDRELPSRHAGEMGPGPGRSDGGQPAPDRGAGLRLWPVWSLFLARRLRRHRRGHGRLARHRRRTGSRPVAHGGVDRRHPGGDLWLHGRAGGAAAPRAHRPGSGGRQLPV
uniref:Transcriptional regulator n=1 Tax=Parastrongyloides trichosuri TaxID=131310 RepID=A0A0N4Z3R1_PARTI